jgi:gamma-tubulin complex component 3
MIQLWVFEGQLSDPFHEFFVAGDAQVSTDKLWFDKYTLRPDMIPSFVTPELAHKVGILICFN